MRLESIRIADSTDPAITPAGWLNYIFVGTELHRYHYSVFDQMFGTFVYHQRLAWL